MPYSSSDPAPSLCPVSHEFDFLSPNYGKIPWVLGSAEELVRSLVTFQLRDFLS